MTLYIKNMVCLRCIMTVETILRNLGLPFTEVRLGEVSLCEAPTTVQLAQAAEALQQVGFELLDDRRKQQIEKIKNLLIQKVQEGDLEEHFSLSKVVSAALHRDYSHISKLFSEVEGITLEQFFILQKIEKTKEWLVYDELTVNEISFRLGYSSVQHLSAQFKKVTGMTPTAFKKMGTGQRRPLDGVGTKNHG